MLEKYSLKLLIFRQSEGVQITKHCKLHPHYTYHNNLIEQLFSRYSEEREQGNANFGRKGEGQTDDVYFSNISALIGPRIDTKFWA